MLVIGGGTPGRLGEVQIVQPADGRELRLVMTTSDEVFDAAISPDGKRLAVAAADRAIRIFNLADGNLERTIENHADWVMAVAWSPDGAKIASASRDKTSKLFEAATGQLLATYSGHNETVYGVAFSADGKFVLSSGRDNRIRQWKVEDAANAGEIGFGGEVYKLVARDEFLFACSADKTVRQFKRADRSAVRSYAGLADWVYAVTYHAGTKRVAAGGYDGRVIIWNAEDGKPVTQFVAAPGYSQ
jgi:WD40 repeat protein